MQKLLQPRTWGITARLVLVATVPALLMFMAVTIALYIAGQEEVAQAVREHGELIVSALAETSQYGVVSGNTAELGRSARKLMRTDPGIASIEITDADRKPLVSVGSPRLPNAVSFEKPIASEVPDIDLFERSEPHASLSPETETRFRTGPTSGYVRVVMSPAPVLAEKRRRIFLAAAVVLWAAVISTAIGLSLAQRLRAPLGAVMAALREIRQGRFDVSLHRWASGELGELQEAIAEMAKGLSVKREELESQVASRTQELQHAVEQTAAADAEKRRLIARSNTLLEEERQRIAIEIHDHMNASLIVLKMKAQHIEHVATLPCDRANTQDIARTARKITETTDSLYVAARNIVKQLRPEVIDTLGLKGALEEMIRDYDHLHPDCHFSLSAINYFPDLRGELAITAYRLIQEALTNVVKHSQATLATVKLEKHDAFPVVLITVKDNGKGFDTQTRRSGSLGLVGMRERVSAIGGLMEIDSSTNKGTTIVFTLPILPPAEAAEADKTGLQKSED